MAGQTQEAAIFGQLYDAMMEKYYAEEYTPALNTAHSLLLKGSLPLGIRIRTHMMLGTMGGVDPFLGFVGHAQTAVDLLEDARTQGLPPMPELLEGAQEVLEDAKQEFEEYKAKGVYDRDEAEEQEQEPEDGDNTATADERVQQPQGSVAVSGRDGDDKGKGKGKRALEVQPEEAGGAEVQTEEPQKKKKSGVPRIITDPDKIINTSRMTTPPRREPRSSKYAVSPLSGTDDEEDAPATVPTETKDNGQSDEEDRMEG